jgi:septum formation protein
MHLILASTSPYRRELLGRLRLPFDVVRPEVDETPGPGESPASVALRLARAKAEAVAAAHPGSWVIGSDQVADLDGTPLGKSGDRETAIAQLLSMSARTVVFRTAVSVRRDDAAFDSVDCTRVRFRRLAVEEVQRYVDAEQPFDCAGSFKSVGFGIALFDAIETHDPTALIGLPMIATARMLRAAGFALP